jgi:UDP:flavonoid glycosyltransferase YjiC (YdhE family)
VLRTAVSRVIEDPRYRAAARRMAARLAAERDDNRAVDELERVAVGVPASGDSTRP